MTNTHNESGKNISIYVVYRNYIPLYSAYCSFWLSQIPNTEFIIPKPNIKLKRLYKIYQKVRTYKIISYLINLISPLLFSEKKIDSGIDYYFYSQMIPTKSPNKPFVIDLEHVNALFNFGNITTKQKEQALNQLCDDKCVSILPWSNAAVESIKNYFKEDFDHFSKKIKVLYPALPNYYKKYGNAKDHSIIKDNSSETKILFIGKDYRRKGLLELLDAFKQLQYKYNNLHLYCISDLPNEVINRYKNYKIDFYPSNFKQEELVKKFFLNVDLFILPTHVDTFGMVLLESLSSGVPVITTKQFAAAEIIQEGINGWFVDSKKLPLNNFSYLNIGDEYLEQFPENILINSIIQVVSDIIDNNKLKDVRKENCYNDFDSNGKFSINKRNYILNSLFHGNN